MILGICDCFRSLGRKFAGWTRIGSMSGGENAEYSRKIHDQVDVIGDDERCTSFVYL